MDQKITITIDEKVYEDFCIALRLTKEEQDIALECCMKRYITENLEKTLRAYNSNAKPIEKNVVDFYCKANKKIPKWALNPEQYNHKIIRAFFMAEQEMGRVTKAELERRCSDKSHDKLYVPKFKCNYDSMTVDNKQSNGKIFEDDGKYVTIWSEVEDTLMKHKESFCD